MSRNLYEKFVDKTSTLQNADSFYFTNGTGREGRIEVSDLINTLGISDKLNKEVDQDILPDTSFSYDIGGSSSRFNSGYFGSLFSKKVDLQNVDDDTVGLFDFYNYAQQSGSGVLLGAFHDYTSGS